MNKQYRLKIRNGDITTSRLFPSIEEALEEARGYLRQGMSVSIGEAKRSPLFAKKEKDKP